MKKEFEKAKKYIKLAASVAIFAMTVYTLIPKSDKITGVDMEEFAIRKSQCAITSNASESENTETAK